MNRCFNLISNHWYVVVFLLSLALQSFMIYQVRSSADSMVRIADLSGDWKVTFDDRPQFQEPEFDDSDWANVSLPGMVKRSSSDPSRRVGGVCWLRKRFRLTNQDLADDLGLILGRISDADVTYVNGVKVGGMGSFPPDAFSMWNHPRSYPLYPILLNPEGDNVIAIRVSYHIACEVMGHLALTDAYGLKNYGFASRFVNVTQGYITIAMGLVLFLIFGAFYLVKPRYDECLYFCLFLLFGLPIVLESCTYWDLYLTPESRYRVLAIAWIGENVTHCLFLHKIYRLDRKWLDQVMVVYYVITIVLSVTLSERVLICWFFPVLIALIIGIYLYSLSCHVHAIQRNHNNSRVFGLFGMAFVLLVLNDCMIYFSKVSGIMSDVLVYQPNTFLYFGTLLLYAGFSMVLVSNYILMIDTVNDLNKDLKVYIVENNLLNRQLDEKKKPSVLITHKAEERIESVIGYIDKHFTDDLTRNNLAEYAGIHPDSLGKQFKQYTGKKINDYIYELRIEKAARLLRENDAPISEIASETGFESLRTFNRIFPKFMKTTPVRYRKTSREN